MNIDKLDELKSRLGDRTVVLELVGLDGNAFAILGAFDKAARHQGWSREDVSAVLEVAMSGDYDHLFATIMDFTRSPDEWGRPFDDD